MMFMFGFVWGCVNLAVAWAYFVSGFAFSSGPKRLFSLLIVTPIAVVLILGPFFSPWIALPLAQKVRDHLLMILYVTPRPHMIFCRAHGSMGATTTPSKSCSTPRPIMDLAISQQPRHIFKEIPRYTPTTFSNLRQTCGHSIFEPLTPRIWRRTNRHHYIRQFQTSHTTLLMTVCWETAPLSPQTPPPPASRGFSIPTIIYRSISRTFEQIQRPTYAQLTSSGHLMMMPRAYC